MASQEACSGRKPRVRQLRMFGSITYAHVSKQRRTKLDDRSAEFVLVGYGLKTKGYKLYDPCSDKITVRRDVFDEERTWE